MAARSETLGRLFQDILGWSKAIALAQGQEKLDLHHLVLGALKTGGGQALLGKLFRSAGPLDPGALDEPFRTPLEQVVEPVTDRKLGLTTRLTKITDQVCARRGELTAEAVLEQVVEALKDDPEWGKPLSKEAGKHPQAAPDRVAHIERALERLTELRVALRSEVIGQDGAVDQVCDAFLPVFLEEEEHGGGGGVNRRGPRVILTFAGPPGVGKTLLAEVLARNIGGAGGASDLLRLDMSAYASHQAHEQLVGFNRVYGGAGRGLLAGFIEDHPDGVVLVDEVEKAHRNTQQLFLQILDAGSLYDNHARADVDFHRATLVFTTNLGRELYDAPNRSGILAGARDLTRTLLEALGREGQPARGTGEGGAGLPLPLVSRLAKGSAILFRRLEGLALEHIADLTFRQVSDEIRARTGLALGYTDPRVLTLFILRFAPGGDARRLTAGLRGFLYATLGDVLDGDREALLRAEPPLLRGACGFRFELGLDEEPPAAIRTSLAGETRLLVIDDDEWSAAVPAGLSVHRVADRRGADTVLRAGGVDLVLLDLHIGAPRRCSDRERGLELLRWLRQRYPSVPVYLFSEFPEARGLSPELLERVSLEGGARGVLSKKFYGNDEENVLERDGFFRQVSDIDAALRRQRLVEHYQRHAKVVEFDVALRPGPAGADGYLTLDLGRVHEVTAVSAFDLGGRGWVSLPRERFDDVAGAERAKERLREVVGWLVDPTPLRRMGLEAPKGVLLTGPPGTGKTTLARAVAGEAEAPFFAVSGAEVFDKWLGQSEANVRELFACARRYAPSVVFIDEIDSLGRARGAGDSTAARAEANVLNELLAQMDGFSQTDQPVFVLAATNRPDVLDPALLRPGRFDLQIEVPLPNADARRALLRLHSRGLPLAEGVGFDGLVRRTSGLSGADLRQVCKEAGLIALRRGDAQITRAALEEAVTTVRMGLASEGAVPGADLRRATAVHEAGHAVAQCLLFPGQPVAQVSILPRGRALGFTESAEAEGGHEPTRDWVCRTLQVLLAGRAAEELLLGPEGASGGCSDDLARATSLAARAVGTWGLDERFGLLSVDGFRRGSRPAEAPDVLENSLAERVQAWLENAHGQAGALLERERPRLTALADALVREETLYGEQVQRILETPGPTGGAVSLSPATG